MAIVIKQNLTTQYIQAALARAAANREAGRIPERKEDGSYHVPSANTAAVYVVRVVNLTQLQASCNCPHGSREDARGTCWHKIAALAEEVRRLGGRYRDKVRRPRSVLAPHPAPMPQLPPAAGLAAASMDAQPRQPYPNAA